MRMVFLLLTQLSSCVQLVTVICGVHSGQGCGAVGRARLVVGPPQPECGSEGGKT